MKKVGDFLKKHFLPHEENDFRAKLLHHDFLIMFLFIAFVLNLIFKNGVWFNLLGFATDIKIEKLLELTNKEREKQGLKPLRLNPLLNHAALMKAEDMFRRDYWAHFGPDGTTPWQFILKAGYQYEVAGENLAKNFLFSDGVVKAWMDSPTHRDNLLRESYTDVGFAVVNGILQGEETTLVVQMFGRPIKENQLIAQEEKESHFLNTEEMINNNSETQVLAGINNTNQPSKNTLLSLPVVSYRFNFLFWIVFSLVLILDFYFAKKLNLFRLTGKNLAHLIFVFFIILGLLIIKNGVIL